MAQLSKSKEPNHKYKVVLGFDDLISFQVSECYPPPYYVNIYAYIRIHLEI